MIPRGRTAAVLSVLLLGLTGCAGDSSVAAEEMTWQEAKTRTQVMELEIAESLPEGEVAKVDQLPTGVLIDCSDTLVTWNGATTVTLTEGTDPEPLVREFEEKYRDSRFGIEVRDPAPAGNYEVQLRSPDTAEIYIVGEGTKPDTFLITSSSDCFTWVDDGKYKRGKF